MRMCRKFLAFFVSFSLLFVNFCNLNWAKAVIGGENKISIIIPVYNAKNYLAECLESILNQNRNDIEIICIDDASTDGSSEILISYQERFPNLIKIIFFSENQGPSKARNRGLKEATGKYVWFVDSDDKILPNSLNRITTLIYENSGSIDVIKFRFKRDDEAYCYPPYLKDGEKPTIVIRNIRDEIIDKDSEYEACCVANKVIRRDLIAENGIYFPHDINQGEDVCFNLCVLIRGTCFLQTNEAFYYYRNTPGSLTHIQEEKTQSAPYIISFISSYAETVYVNLKDSSRFETFSTLLYLMFLNAFHNTFRCRAVLHEKNIETVLASAKTFNTIVNDIMCRGPQGVHPEVLEKTDYKLSKLRELASGNSDFFIHKIRESREIDKTWDDNAEDYNRIPGKYINHVLHSSFDLKAFKIEQVMIMTVVDQNHKEYSTDSIPRPGPYTLSVRLSEPAKRAYLTIVQHSTLFNGNDNLRDPFGYYSLYGYCKIIREEMVTHDEGQTICDYPDHEEYERKNYSVIVLPESEGTTVQRFKRRQASLMDPSRVQMQKTDIEGETL